MFVRGSIMRALMLEKKTFCGFSMGRNQYWAGRVYDLCVYYMTGTPEGSTESAHSAFPLHHRGALMLEDSQPLLI